MNTVCGKNYLLLVCPAGFYAFSLPNSNVCVCVCVCVCLYEMGNVTGVYCFKNNPSCKAENSGFKTYSSTRECITRSGRSTLPHAGLPALLI